MTPPISRDASVDAPATHSDAGAPVADASADTRTARSDAGTPANPSTPDASAPASTDDPQQWTIFGRASIGAADHGGRNATIFGYSPISQFGDWIGFGIAGGALYDLTRGNVRVRLGGTLVYNRDNGGENTSGSHINIFGLAPRIELDWRRAWGRGPVAGPSRLGIEWALGYGFGTTTVDGGFRLHDQGGFAMIPRADLNLINVRAGSVELGLDFFVQNPTVFGSAHNSGFLEIGGAFTLRGAIEPAPTVVVGEACSADRRGEIVQRIHNLQSENAGLREENAQNALFLESIRTQLEVQGVDQAQLLQSLRTALTQHIQAQLSGANPTPRTEVVEQLRRLYGSYLRSRAENPVTDPAERDRQAQEIFPDDFDPSTEDNRTLAARTIFPDDFDPYAFREVTGVDVPDPLPAECDDLERLRTSLEDERADLREQRGLIDGLVRMALVRLGVPNTAAPSLIRAITRLSEIHFITARPQGAPDRVTVADSDIAPLNAAAEAWGRDHRGEVRPQPEIEAAFRAIFPRTRRAPSDTTEGRAEEYSPSLEVIRSIAETLRSPDMRGAHFYVVGHTDSRGDDAMNQRLSLRRAQAIRDALIMYGVDPAMITPLGRGESQTVYYYDQANGRGRDPHIMSRAEVTMLNRDGIRGAALTDEVRGRQAVNRRIEMFVCMPNTTDAICQQLDTEVRASSAPATGGDAGAPISTVVTGGGGGDAAPRTPSPTPRVAPDAATGDASAPATRRDE
ncbi:MAG: OmpA family protein [bacterium]